MGAKVYKKVINLPLELREKTLELDMTLWDIMGDLSLVELTDEAYFRGVQGLLVVCDMTRRSTVESLDDWMSNAPERLKRLPMYILVNKNDLVDQVEIAEDDVFRLGDIFSSPILMTSAKTGSNVQSAFEYLAKSIVENQMDVDTDFLIEQRFGNLGRPVTVSAKPF
jgi:GTPase SAR1 family protein